MLASVSLVQGVTVVALVGYIIYRLYAHLARQRKLPPGPKPIPIVGNVRDFPPPGVPEFEHWLHHKDRYGPISSVMVLGSTIVIVHDKKAARDILEKTASKTSGRPSMTFSSKLCGYKQALNFRGYDDEFRRARKMLHQELGTKVLSARFHGVQEAGVSRQLVRTLEQPEKLLTHFRTTAGSIILESVYGYSVNVEGPDYLIGMIEKVMAQFSRVAVPMTWAVDIFPILQHLPEWFPGASFHKVAKECRRCCRENVYTSYRFVERQMAAGVHRPSFTSRLIEQFRQDDEKTTSVSYEDKEAIAWSAASLYAAAADTTVLTLAAFTLAMIKFPEVQQKAQAEIDHVVGPHRLPTIEDRDNLPYVNALVKEAQRWWTVVPLGFPHVADEDIEYNDMLIPKGSYILPAVWWFLHDPEVHPDPESFDPERFLEPRNEPDPMDEAFGYGRRICPGRFFADSSLFLNIVKVLAAFKIQKALAPEGTEIDVEVKLKPGILNDPSEFPFRVTPRSSEHVELIRQAGLKYPQEPTDAELLEVVTE